ncbi:outer membrane beta-barrel protein [Sediminibacterium ginsengisoli]|uniref:Outer membrane protein beta-barrel domain-containing protein n=1 Tax=Sediminibacterium ginsengisoli TaxID=413434 RepID=A0A1T4QVX8_9BACT|nr:outer membrane beta-barrel protein [Sediminibacterium ginsengisoli]SKA07796.1 Outer membrane protein beta-barrel domain-containing protein [Sediminibacterium ginsengisoli]
MTDSPFDNFIRNSLREHAAPVPEGLWDKIHPEKDRRRAVPLFRRPAAWLALAAIIAGLVAGSYFWFTGKSGQDATGMATAISPDNNNSNTDPKINESITAAAAGKDSGTHEQSDLNETGMQANKTSVAPNLIVAQQATSPHLTSPHSGIPQTSKIPASLLSNAIGNEYTPSYTEQTPVIAAEEYANYSAFNFSEAATVNGSRFSLRNNFEAPEMVNAVTHTRSFPNTYRCPGTGTGIFNTDWQLEVYASPDMAFRSVQNVSASAQYMARKDSSTSMRPGFTAGIRIVKPLSDQFLLKTGIQYTQMNEKFTYRTENEIRTTTVVTTRQIIRAPGDTVLVSDTSTLQQIGYRNNTIRNRFRSIDIPLTAGYQFGTEDNDIRVGINAGVIFNLSSWYEGVILDTSLAAVPVNKDAGGMYKSRLGLGLYGSISLMKRIGDNTHLFFEPYFRYNLGSMTTADASFKQRFSLGGLAVGLRFNLNR